MNYLVVVLCFAGFSPSLNSVTTSAQSPPLMIKQPVNGEFLILVSTTKDIADEKPFILQCEAEGTPAPTYRWTKNGEEYVYRYEEDSYNRSRVQQQPRTGSLVIMSPRDGDIAQFQCFADNEYGTATSNSVFLRKAKLDSFAEEPVQTVTATEGEPFKLSCRPPNGYPKPLVYWFIDGSDQMPEFINSSRITVDPEGNLWFSNVTQQDASNNSVYACAAVSTFRNEYKLGRKVILKVQSRKLAPVAQYLTRKNEVAHRGETATLYCIYGGTPVPETRWFKNGQPLQDTNRISTKNYGKSLVIKNITCEDKGAYQCEVSNGVGEAKSHTMSLKVLAKPYFIEEPQIQNKAENETAEFHCTASGNPEPQIIWIYNGKPISEAPFNPRRTVETNSIIIENLQKNDTGNYGCNATNSLGYVYKDVYVNVS